MLGERPPRARLRGCRGFAGRASGQPLPRLQPVRRRAQPAWRRRSRRESSTGAVVGDVRYTDPYEGPPGCVHGGFIAAGFDEMLGFAQSLSGQPGMTGRLLVSYRSPTPLHQPVRYEGRVDRVEGRKIFTVATLHHGDTLCAEAEGLFISMKPEVFQRLMRDRSDQG